MKKPHFDLQRLISPVDPARFKADIWESRPLVIKRADPTYFAALLSMSDMEQILSFVDPDNGTVRLMKDGATLDLDRGKGVSRLLNPYRDGGTLVLQSLHTYWPTLTRFSNSLANDLSCGFQVNAYLTPPTTQEARGLGAHYDTHDVFVLQIYGSKHWRIYGSPIRLPLEEQACEADSGHMGRLREEFDLAPGDCVYIPRGYYHEAWVSRSPRASLHLTVGVHPTKWTHVIQILLETAAAGDPRLRESLPIGYGNDEACLSLVRHRLPEILSILANRSYVNATISKILANLMDMQRPTLDGNLTDLERSSQLRLRTRLWKRSVLFWIRTDRKEVWLHFEGKTIKMPRYLESAVRFICMTHEFSAAELDSEIDDAGKLVLVRRLLREGFLTLRKW